MLVRYITSYAYIYMQQFTTNKTKIFYSNSPRTSTFVNITLGYFLVFSESRKVWGKYSRKSTRVENLPPRCIFPLLPTSQFTDRKTDNQLICVDMKCPVRCYFTSKTKEGLAQNFVDIPARFRRVHKNSLTKTYGGTLLRKLSELTVQLRQFVKED